MLRTAEQIEEVWQKAIVVHATIANMQLAEQVNYANQSSYDDDLEFFSHAMYVMEECQPYVEEEILNKFLDKVSSYFKLLEL